MFPVHENKCASHDCDSPHTEQSGERHECHESASHVLCTAVSQNRWFQESHSAALHPLAPCCSVRRRRCRFVTTMHFLYALLFLLRGCNGRPGDLGHVLDYVHFYTSVSETLGGNGFHVVIALLESELSFNFSLVSECLRVLATDVSVEKSDYSPWWLHFFLSVSSVCCCLCLRVCFSHTTRWREGNRQVHSCGESLSLQIHLQSRL